MQWQVIVAITIGILMALFPAALIWYINGGGIYEAIVRRKRTKLLEMALPNVNCSTNTDCPPGFICVRGRCVPQKAR